MKVQARSVLLAAFALAGLPSLALADTVRLAGATTVLNVVVAPNRATVEKATGHQLEINANATGKGLVDLAEGRADAAMVSEPMDIALAAAEVAGKKIDGATLRMHEIRKDEIVFIVHPANPVKKLTLAQLGDIHTGKITNWKQVGGKDMPITVYSDALTGGTRAMIKKIVMNNQDYAASVKSLTSVSRIADLVPGDEAGIGGLGRGFVKADGKAVIVETSRIERPLAFVTVGEPQPKVQQVIAALRTAGNAR
ncbi:phosphate ABC transporter substrate-binding protein [Ramlibacter sp. G-1-2-2]|uniref:Phosphate ABC transporter substrate-binding protein n=1 Tax=Ramlibacter agri TaxID=2728837 RepID=A0A848HA58_9BURK|nr:substrate-binding domain-containing protein [Ramlibacter agri]NML46321.1 phosphate ABC transporter substrate-binding protein [Ramlibacter agri]